MNVFYDYFAAGADLIITNTYQASVEGFMEHLAVTKEQAYELIVRAAELAKRARTQYLEEYQDYVQKGKYLRPYIIQYAGLNGMTYFINEYRGSKPPQ